MKDDEHDDAIHAEGEFLRGRHKEIHDGLAKGLSDLGVTVGPGEDPREITAVIVPELRLTITELLEQSGNSSLAARFAEALDLFLMTNERVQVNTAAGIVDESARDAMNDAVEEVERVSAEVDAWLEKKGGV